MATSPTEIRVFAGKKFRIDPRKNRKKQLISHLVGSCRVSRPVLRKDAAIRGSLWSNEDIDHTARRYVISIRRRADVSRVKRFVEQARSSAGVLRALQ